MDTAVALVRADLNVNGYFTVVEYPVLEGHLEKSVWRITSRSMRTPSGERSLNVLEGRIHCFCQLHRVDVGLTLNTKHDRRLAVVRALAALERLADAGRGEIAKQNRTGITGRDDGVLDVLDRAVRPMPWIRYRNGAT